MSNKITTETKNVYVSNESTIFFLNKEASVEDIQIITWQ